MDRPRFLADESCDFAVVRALRRAGYDVDAVSERASRSVDRDLVQQAARDRRILVTEDKDFGWLVFASHEGSVGVILLRYPGNARSDLAADAVRIVREHARELEGAFVVLEPGRARIGRLPRSSS